MDPITITILAVGAVAAVFEDRGKWKKKWRGLKEGQSPAQAKQAIGEPTKVDVQPGVTVWSFTAGGKLIFAGERLVAWTEPKV